MFTNRANARGKMTPTPQTKAKRLKRSQRAAAVAATLLLTLIAVPQAQADACGAGQSIGNSSGYVQYYACYRISGEQRPIWQGYAKITNRLPWTQTFSYQIATVFPTSRIFEPIRTVTRGTGSTLIDYTDERVCPGWVQSRAQVSVPGEGWGPVAYSPTTNVQC